MELETLKDSAKATLISRPADLADYCHPMKLCPVCKSISSDTDMTCGVCGHDLSEVPYESRDEIVLEECGAAKAEENLERELSRRLRKRLVLRLEVGSLLGLGFIMGGIYLIQQRTQADGLLAGVVLVMLGMLTILMAMNWSLAGRRIWIRWKPVEIRP